MSVSASGADVQRRKRTVISGGEDPVSVTGRDRDGTVARSGGQERSPTAAQTLLRLLQTTGLASTGRGWRDVLYIGFIGVLCTVAAVMFVWSCVTAGIILLRAGKSLVYIASYTAFFGLQFALMWLSLMICFVVGRRQSGTLLLTIGTLMERNVLHGSAVSTKRMRRHLNWLLCAVVGLMGLTFAMAFRTLPLDLLCSVPSTTCMLTLISGLLLWFFFFSGYLIPFKLTFASLQISIGFSAINSELQTVVDGDRPPDLIELRRLRSLQDELSRTFTQLINTMSTELITVMLSGILQLVALLMMLVGAVEAGEILDFVEVMLMYLAGAALAVALPCEMTQRVLNAVSETRDLLLRSEWQRAEMLQELTLFRETINRDLDTLGDLGLFRLQRSTLLAVAATILTYVVVLVQFFVGEMPARSLTTAGQSTEMASSSFATAGQTTEMANSPLATTELPAK